MAKLPTIHSYSDQAAFDRLLILIATLVKHPGVGNRRSKATRDQDSLNELCDHMQQVAIALEISLPTYSVHTLRKDLMTLRDYGILERHRHDWGYYLGSGAMTFGELRIALNALASQATYQGDAQARRIYEGLKQRLKSLDLERQGELFYPVRAHFNRAIVYTDPEEMLTKRENRNTLFHCVETLEAAIVQGVAVELYRVRDPYRNTKGYLTVYPLQLMYQDTAWYLLYEEQKSGHLAIARVDRFKDHARILDAPGRGIGLQFSSLEAAHKLLRNGWGLFLGEPEEQRLERQGESPLVTVKVRFFPPAIGVILEGEQRHPSQKIGLGAKDAATGQPAYVDYRVKLPGRSLSEFLRWVNRFMNQAIVLTPADLAQRHRQAAMELVERYGFTSKG